MVNELDNKIYDHGKSISIAVKGVENKIQHQTEGIQKGIDELVQSRDKLTNFLNQLNQTQDTFLRKNQAEHDQIFKQFSETQKALIDEAKKIHDLLSIKDIAIQLRGSIIDAGNYISESINNTEKTIDSQTTAIQKGMNNLAETQLQFEHFLGVINESQTQFINDIKNINYKAEENIDQQLKLNTDKLLRVISDIKQSLDKHSSLNSEKLLSVVSELTQSLDKHSRLIQEVLLEPQPIKKKSSMKIIREILNKKFF